jgi:hypothetical protein
VCLWGRGHVHPGGQWLPSLRRACRLRGAPELHGAGRGGHMRMQRGSGVQHRRERLCELDDARHVHEGRAELYIRIREHDMHQRRVQRRGVLHQ